MPPAGCVVIERTAYIALGANLGNAAASVQHAMEAIHMLQGTSVTGRSALYRSAPIDAGGPDYVNAVVQVTTTLPAPLLLQALQQIEQASGRTRLFPNAPRTLDLDLLLYGDGHISSPTLTVPHPRMAARAFVLLPLAELAPQRVSAAQLAAVAGQKISRIA